MYRQTVAFYLIASKNTKKINHYLWDVHKHQNWQCPLHFSHLNKLDILIKLHSLKKKKYKSVGKEHTELCTILIFLNRQ